MFGVWNSTPFGEWSANAPQVFSPAWAFQSNYFIGFKMYKKNTAVTGLTFGLVSSTDGSAVTSGTTSGSVTIDGGTQSAIAGAFTHEGNGQWSVDLTAAEMNGDQIGLVFTNSSAINAFYNISTYTEVDANLLTINSQTLPVDNIESQFDGTGITGDNFPAAQGDVSGVATSAEISALNDFNPATDTVANVTTVQTTISNTDMRGTDGANTVTPDNASVAAILADTNELQQNQNNWTTATGFSTFDPSVDVVANVALVDTVTLNSDMLTTGAIFAAGDIDGYSLEQSQRLILAASTGKLSGSTTSNVSIKAADDSKTRISATVDLVGNRTSLILDAD